MPTVLNAARKAASKASSKIARPTSRLLSRSSSGPRRLRLNKRNVEAIARPTQGEIVVWDDHLSGFGVRVAKSGRRTYFVQAHTRAGREGKMSCGVHGIVTAEQARDIARAHLGVIAAGGDPFEARRAEKRAEDHRRNAPTMDALIARYLEHAELHKRPRPLADDRSKCRRIIGPKLGRRRVDEIERADIEKLHREMKHAPVEANRLVALLHRMFNLGIGWGYRSDNPARGVQKFPEAPRERYLKPAELKRLVAALVSHPSRVSACAVSLLLVTGSRRSEVMRATWDQFDLSDGVWTKPSSHTKQKRQHRVPLSRPALAVLAEMAALAEKRIHARGPNRDLSPTYVFPGAVEGEPITELKRFWSSVCKRAALKDMRLHDLRHTYASMLVGAGYSLPVVGALLGHSQPGTTARYAHLADDPLRRATNVVGEIVGPLGKERPARIDQRRAD